MPRPIQGSDVIGSVNQIGSGDILWTVDDLMSFLPAGLLFTQAGTGAVPRTIQSKLREVSVNAKDFGGFWDGIGDDTDAINRAVAALPSGGGIVHLPAGITRCNVVISRSGVIVDGRQLVGNQAATAYPTSNMMIAHDPTLPAFTIGVDGSGVEGSGLRNMPLRGAWDYGGGRLHADYGVLFAGGSKRCVFDGSYVRDFAVANIDWRSAPGTTSSENRIANVTSAVTAATNLGARAMRGIDLDGGETQFSNDHFLSDVYLVASAGHVALELDGSTFWAATVKIDCRDGGVIFKQTSSALPPRVMGSTEIDGATSAVNVLHFGRDLVTSSAQIETPFSGRGSVDGLVLHSQVQTTGAVSSGSPTMTVASATGFYAGRYALIYSSSGIFSAKVTNVSGTTITLASAPTFSAAGATVYVGDASSGNGKVHGTGALMNLFDNVLRGPAERAQAPYLSGRNALGSVYPYNGFNLVWDFNSGTGLVLSQRAVDNVTAASLSRTANVATITGPMSGARAPADSGWFIYIWGANEEGFNGAWPIETIAGDFTVTFANTGANVAAATGTIKYALFRCLDFSGGKITLPDGTGVEHRTPQGVMAPVRTEGGNTILYVPNGDTTGGKTGLGRTIAQFGSAALGTTGVVWSVSMQITPFTNVAQMNGVGMLGLGQGQAPTISRPGVQLLDGGTDTGADAGTSMAIFQFGGRLVARRGTTTTPIGRKVAVPGTATTAGLPGEWAADTSFFYAYTGDGTTHTWRRVAVAAW